MSFELAWQDPMGVRAPESVDRGKIFHMAPIG